MTPVTEALQAEHYGAAPSLSADPLTEVLGNTSTEHGRTLLQLATAGPMLLIFLRHFGCTFCRQAIDDIAQVKGDLDRRGILPVFIHLGTPDRAKPYFDYYGLPDVERVSDPGAALYRHAAFSLSRTHPMSHFLLPSVWKGWLSGALLKHGFSPLLQEDASQMPGVFLVKDQRIVKAFKFRRISDRPDYLAMTQ